MIIGISVGASGYYFWQNTHQSNPTTPLIENTGTEQNAHFSYQILTTPTYTNKTLGFSITVPSSWMKYVIREDDNWPNIVITIGLPLDNASSTRFLGYPESAAQVIDIAHFQITPANLWKSDKGSCAAADGPCFENGVIASSTKYIFSTLYPRPHASWDFAGDYGSSETYVGAVWNDFDLHKSLQVVEPIN